MLDKYADVLSVKDIAAILGCGRGQAAKIARTLPHVKVGRAYKVRKDILFHYIGGENYA